MHPSNNKLFYRQRELTTKDFPAPIKLGTSITAWRASDVIDWIARQEEASYK